MNSDTKMQTNGISRLSPWFWLAVGLLIVLKLWLARGMTFNGIGYMYADDQLFINQADAILRGDWLGDYNFLTLFKGPFYPLFIAGVTLLGVPLLTAQQVLYCAACLAICMALFPLLRNRIFQLILLAVLLFNPMSVTNTVATRALREGIYPALTLLSLAGAIGLVLRLDMPLKTRIPWILLTGFSLGAFWLTREERIWILPTLFALVLISIYRIRVEKVTDWRSALISLAIPALILGAATLSIAVLNLKNYGVFAITEYDSPVFLKAYGSLTRVKPVTWQPLIPVASETRTRIYAVSPTFRILEPYLEGDVGRRYSRYGEVVKNNPNEMGGGWFHTAFRESIDRAGLTQNGRFPSEFYVKLTDEITLACDSGSLDCSAPRSSFMAVWNNEYIGPFFANFWKSVMYLVRFDGYDGELKDCLGTDEQLKPFIDLTRERCWHLHPSVFVQGWVVKPGEAISIWAYDSNGMKVISPTYHSYSPDLKEHFTTLGVTSEQAAFARFQLEADCPTGCSLVVKAEDGRVLEKISLAEPTGSPDTPTENGLYYQIEMIDWREGDEVKYPLPVRQNTVKARIFSRLAFLYQALLPWLTILAMLIFIFQLVFMIQKHKLLLIWGIEICLLVALVVRLVMIAWLETSSIDAIITTYLSPIHPLLLLFIVVSIGWLCIEGFHLFHPRRARQSHEPSEQG